jgi:hypothetical protein
MGKRAKPIIMFLIFGIAAAVCSSYAQYLINHNWYAGFLFFGVDMALASIISLLSILS